MKLSDVVEPADVMRLNPCKTSGWVRRKLPEGRWSLTLDEILKLKTVSAGDRVWFFVHWATVHDAMEFGRWWEKACAPWVEHQPLDLNRADLCMTNAETVTTYAFKRDWVVAAAHCYVGKQGRRAQLNWWRQRLQ